MSIRHITHYEAAEAEEVASTTNSNKIYIAATSQHSCSAVRFAAALNRSIDRVLLEQMVSDQAPHVAELVAARLAGMDKHERLLTMWAKSDDPHRDGDRPMEAEGVAVVRHITKSNVKNLTVNQCLALVRQALAKKQS